MVGKFAFCLAVLRPGFPAAPAFAGGDGPVPVVCVAPAQQASR
jgi:hypothetical protein